MNEPEQKQLCGVCCGAPLPSGKTCICGGRGTIAAECEGLHVAVVDLERELVDRERTIQRMGKQVSAAPPFDVSDMNGLLNVIRAQLEATKIDLSEASLALNKMAANLTAADALVDLLDKLTASTEALERGCDCEHDYRCGRCQQLIDVVMAGREAAKLIVIYRASKESVDG